MSDLVGNPEDRFSHNEAQISFSGLITSVGEERADFSAIDYSLLRGLCTEGFPLPLCAWDRLRYFIVNLPWPSISLFWSEGVDVHAVEEFLYASPVACY